MIEDYFKLASSNLRHRQVRSWLTIIGIFIGIAAVVALISIGQGLQGAISEQFQKLGTDKITIQPGAEAFGAPGTSFGVAKLTEKDIETIKKINGVDMVIGYLLKIAKVEFKDEGKYPIVIGTPLESELNKVVAEAQGYEINKGRNLKDGDRYAALAGYGLVNKDVFKKEVRVGDKVLIQGKEFKVVGTLKKTGSSYDDNVLIIPIDDLREVLNLSDEYDVIMVKVKDVDQVDKIAEEIKKDLRKERDLKAGEEDFRVETTQQLMNRFTTIFGIVSAVFIGIAAISLVVGGVGIMNTMYTAVMERTREIGIMKAIGAKNQDIFSLFFIESGLLGLVGGAIGILIGIGIGKAVQLIAGQALGGGYLRAIFPWWLIVGALAFSFIIGAISGTFPAIQASRMKPVDALRHE